MAKPRRATYSKIHPVKSPGIRKTTPLDCATYDRPPTNNDFYNHQIFDEWIDGSSTLPYDVWKLVAKIQGVATWVKMFGGTGLLLGLRADDANVVYPLLNIIDVTGGTLITTTAAVANTLQVDITDGTATQLIIGGGGAGADWGELTSTGGTVSIAPGVNPYEINLEATGVAGLTQLGSDTGIAMPAAGQIDILGGVNINTAAPTPGANDVTINLNNNVDIPGTLTVSSLGRGVVQTDAGGLFTSNEGTDGQLLISSSAGAPAWSTLTAGTGVTIVNAANNVTISAALAGLPYAFYAYLNATVLNVTGNGVAYKVIFESELYDIGNNYNTGTGEFIAPVNGYYFFRSSINFRDIVAGFTSCETFFHVQTPAITSFSHNNINPQPIIDNTAGTAEYQCDMTDIVYLTTGQSFYVTAGVGGGAQTVDLIGLFGIQYRTNFSGYFIGT